MCRHDSYKILVGAMLLTALVVSGCSGAGSEPTPGAAAAARPVGVADLEISSPSFTEIRPRVRIPKKNTCFEENMSPPLSWSGVPQGAKSLALIVDEPEERISSPAYYSMAATGGAVHWVLYNIPPDVTGLPEGVSTTTDVLPDGTVQGVNDLMETGQIGYTGPCPPPAVSGYYTYPTRGPSSDPPHAYFFRLYALDAAVGLAPGATQAELLAAMDGHILAYGETVGKFHPPRQQGWYTDSSNTPIPNTPTPVP